MSSIITLPYAFNRRFKNDDEDFKKNKKYFSKTQIINFIQSLPSNNLIKLTYYGTNGIKVENPYAAVTFNIKISSRNIDYSHGIKGQNVDILMSSSDNNELLFVFVYSDNNKYIHNKTPFIFPNTEYISYGVAKKVGVEGTFNLYMFTEKEVEELLDADYSPSMAYAVKDEDGTIIPLFYRKIIYSHPSFSGKPNFNYGLFDFEGKIPYHKRYPGLKIFEGPFAEYNAHIQSSQIKNKK